RQGPWQGWILEELFPWHHWLDYCSLLGAISRGAGAAHGHASPDDERSIEGGLKMFAFKVWWENEERRLRNKGVNDEQLEAMRKIAWKAWVCAVNIALKAVKNTMDENQW